MKLTSREFDVLDHTDSIWRKMNWYLCTGRLMRVEVVRALVAKGMLRELPQLVGMCDDDGFHLEPERYKIGYEITDKGRAALDAAKVRP